MLEKQLEIDNINLSKIRSFGSFLVPSPEYGEMKLQVFPFIHNGMQPTKLPENFIMWEFTLRKIMEKVPVQLNATQFFVTIDSKYFTEDEYHRRDGIHIDGNFCADPSLSPLRSWGGGKSTWAGILSISDIEKPDNSHVKIGFSLPYKDLIIPIGKYISGDLGGTLVVSSEIGCKAYPGIYNGGIGNGGMLNDESKLGQSMILDKNTLYFMTSNCPHETLMIKKGTRRTFVRVTFPHNYENYKILNHGLIATK